MENYLNKLHSFNVEYAKQYGVGEAIFINNMIYWIDINREEGRNFKEGHYWTYNSIKAFLRIFPYWTQRQIERIINSLVKQKIVIKGNFNPIKYDRTNWYAFVDESAFLVDFTNSPKRGKNLRKKISHSIETVEPIPYNNTYRKTNSSNRAKTTPTIPNNKKPKKEQIAADPDFKKKLYEILIEWNAFASMNKLGQIRAIAPDRQRMIKERLSEEVFNLKEIIEKCKESPWLMGKQKSKGSNDYFVLTFDKIIKDSFYVKILEGAYGGATKSKPVEFEQVEDDYRVEDDLRG